MPLIPFSHLPPQSRLWVFPSGRPLNPQEEEHLLSQVDAFLQDWAAHGKPLQAGRSWREGRFLLVAVDDSAVPPSGCSIDSLIRILKEEGASLGTSFLDRGPVQFRVGGEVRQASRGEFRRMAEAGAVTPDTPVFDHAITRLSELLDGKWEKPAARSWHGKAFFGL